MISIIIPVYNVSNYIDQCLQSVLGQTFTDWECILVDDGSKDGSADICDVWANKDSRFKVIHQVNQGVSKARNNGMSEAKCDFICFIDSDDWVSENYLSHLIDSIGNAELAVSGLSAYRNDKLFEENLPPKQGVMKIGSEDADLFIKMNENSLLYGPVNKMFRTDIIKNNAIRFPENCSYAEDLTFCFSYLEHVNTIALCQKSDYHYNVRENTLSKSVRLDSFDNDYKPWCIRRDYMQSRSMWNDNAKRVMYRYLWGQVYNGLFLFPKIPNSKYGYLKHVLAIPEVEEMCQYGDLFECSKWIKIAIVKRWAWVFYLYFKIH